MSINEAIAFVLGLAAGIVAAAGYLWSVRHA